MTKPGDTTDTDKYIYSGYGLGFDSTGDFTHPQGGKSRNIIIFGADLLNSVHATNQTQNILILGHGRTQKVNNTTSLHYNGDNSYLYVNGKEVTKFKAKDFKNKVNQLALGSISASANLSISDIEDSKLYGNVYDFSVDYSSISNDKIHDIHAYLMRKNGII